MAPALTNGVTGVPWHWRWVSWVWGADATGEEVAAVPVPGVEVLLARPAHPMGLLGASLLPQSPANASMQAKNLPTSAMCSAMAPLACEQGPNLMA
jgi:hypothetical protein